MSGSVCVAPANAIGGQAQHMGAQPNCCRVHFSAAAERSCACDSLPLRLLCTAQKCRALSSSITCNACSSVSRCTQVQGQHAGSRGLLPAQGGLQGEPRHASLLCIPPVQHDEPAGDTGHN